MSTGELFDVYPCDPRVENAKIFGATFPVALTFGYDARGRLVTPPTPLPPDPSLN